MINKQQNQRTCWESVWVGPIILAATLMWTGQPAQSNPTKPNPTKPNQTQPNSTRSNPTKPVQEKKAFQPRNQAERIVENMVAAMGGRGNLAMVRSMKATGITLLTTPLGEKSGELTTYSQKPNYQRVDITIGGQTITQSFYPNGGWLQQGNAVLPMPRSMLSVAQAESNRTDIELRYFVDGIKIVLLGERKVENTPCYVIQFIDKEKRITEYAIAKDSWLPLERIYHGPSPLGGGTVKFSTRQTDFRWVYFLGSTRGVKVPFRIGNFMNDRKIGSIQLKEVHLNPKQLEASFFHPPNPTE